MRVADNEFNPAADFWATAPDAAKPPMKPEAYQLTRWIGDWMMDFASRASWCVAGRYEDANHAPELTVAEGLDLAVAPGERVALHAVASDPDGDVVSCGWFRYTDADSREAEVALDGGGDLCELTVPADARPGDTIHLLRRATVEGNGRDEYMVSYRRVILTVA